MTSFKRSYLILCSAAVLVLLSASACGGGALSGRLAEIETYIEKRPADAVESLKSIPAAEISRAEDKAKYALLMSMALDKTYVDKDDFSVLQPAIDYYSKKGSQTDRMRTAYYEGRIYSNKGEMTAAMSSWLKAVDAGEKSSDLLTRARAYFAMGNVYSRLFQWDKYVDTYIKAAELFTNQNNSGKDDDYERRWRHGGSYRTIASKSVAVDVLLAGDELRIRFPEVLQGGEVVTKAPTAGAYRIEVIVDGESYTSEFLRLRQRICFRAYRSRHGT